MDWIIFIGIMAVATLAIVAACINDKPSDNLLIKKNDKQ